MLKLQNQNGVPYIIGARKGRVVVCRDDILHGVTETWDPCGPGDCDVMLSHYAIGAVTGVPFHRSRYHWAERVWKMLEANRRSQK